MSAAQTAFDYFKTSVNDSIKSTSDYLTNLNKNIAAHDAEFNHKAGEFFHESLETTNHAFHEVERLEWTLESRGGHRVAHGKAEKLPGQVEEANQEHLEEVKASLAKLEDELEHLKTQAAEYDHKFNSNVAHFFSQQKQHIHDHLQHAKEHLNAVFHHHNSA
ncbi:hypothetical protein AC1031_000252 [Aphanomyces cochlioides]|nr:hypothetical protein AC1031_000252 [Aphanomyces cochlioides]